MAGDDGRGGVGEAGGEELGGVVCWVCGEGFGGGEVGGEALLQEWR